jgi:hypothetical protein
MECAEFLERYSEFLDGEVEASRVPAYQRHILSCSGCAEYDRVMRRGLRLVRELEPPEASPDIVPQLQRRFLDRSERSPWIEYSRAALVAGATTLAIMATASIPNLSTGDRAVQLPPVVVETPASRGVPSLFAPPPTFAPQASFLTVPEFPSDQLLAPSSGRFSLFRVSTDTPEPREEGDEALTE